MGGSIALSVAVLSICTINDPTLHHALHTFAQVLSAVGLVYSLAAALTVALAASASVESDFQVEHRRCTRLLAPSVLCNLLGLACVIARA